MSSPLKRSFLILALSFVIPSFGYGKQTFEDWYNKLTPNEKVAKVFVTGLRGKSISQFEKNLLKTWPVSGLIFFKRNFDNPNQFKNLNDQINTKNMFTFADQEGGSVVRIGSLYDSPPPLAVGSLQSSKVTGYLGKAYGSLLRDLNISANLAPVVDIKHSDESDFISNRSFGSNANEVAQTSLEFSKGLLLSGTIPTLKHFPGIGGIKVDSHKKTPVKKSTLQTLISNDWKPYIHHAKSKIPFFVMTSHTKLIVDNENYGIVTYSKKSIEKLREFTSSEQVVMSDDLEMQGAKINNKAFSEAALTSFMAGHDLLLIGWSGTKLLNTLEFFKSNLKNKAFENRLKQSLKRIYALKKLNDDLKETPPPFTAEHSLRLSRLLNSKISDYLLAKEVKKNYYRSPAYLNDSIVFSSDPIFTRHFDKIKAYSLLKTSTKKIIELCVNKSCVLHLTGNKTAEKIKSLLKSSNKTTFTIINSVDPNMTPDNKEHKVYNVLTRSYELGKQVEELLTKSNFTAKN